MNEYKINPNLNQEQLALALTFQKESLPCVEMLSPTQSLSEMQQFKNDVKQAMAIANKEVIDERVLK